MQLETRNSEDSGESPLKTLERGGKRQRKRDMERKREREQERKRESERECESARESEWQCV